MESFPVDLVPGQAAPADPPRAPSYRSVARSAPAQAAGENFPVAPRWLPRDLRDGLNRIYAYARFIDDVGDRCAGDRLDLLDRAEEDLRRVAAGSSAGTPAPLAGLRPLFERTGLPLPPLLDLIEANRMDQVRHEYETFGDLLEYCRLSAAPVGRLVLHLAGAATAANDAASDAVCAGLQLLEHAQDVGEDARAGRIYLPRIDRDQCGVLVADLLAPQASTGLREVVGLLVARANRLLDSGPGLVHRLSGWPRVAVSGYLAGGRATAAALRRAGYDVLGDPVRARRRAVLYHGLRTLAGRP